MRLAALLLVCTPLAWGADAINPRQQLSWLAIDGPREAQAEGQAFEVAVDYGLQDGPPATLTLSGYGPWIDLPDGRYETKRHHIDYPGFNAQAVVQPGTGRQVFRFTVPKGGTGVLWAAAFRDQDGKRWPWEVRDTTAMKPGEQPIALVATAPNNLFTYDEPVAFDLALRGQAGAATTATWSVTALDGTVAGRGEQALTVPAAGAGVRLAVPWTRRGVFGLTVAVAGCGTATTTFARIPDLMAITKGAPTRFGLHGILGAAEPAVHDRRMRAARRLGLTSCRQFVTWNTLEPSRGAWRLEGLDLALAKAAEHGIAPLLCLGSPPPWAMKNRYKAGFDPFAFDEAGWSDAVGTLAARYKGRVDTWEWLNEIVPGPEPDPIGTYLAMCRLGTAAAKAADPQVRTALAGGLWPRSFRQGLLAAGVAQHVDVLPIHGYGAGDDIGEARADLAAVGAERVEVWDDESAKGVSTWRMPQAEALQRGEQREFAMTRWPDELAAGAQRIYWFGGAGDPAGNWDIFWGDGSPRPVAATLAVLAAKLHGARPQGDFRLGETGPFHLFAVGERAVLVAPAGSAPATLRMGAGPLTATDDQGEERAIAAAAVGTSLPLGAMPTIIEGGDLAVLRAYTAPTLLAPEVAVLAGDAGRLRVRLTNRGATPLAATIGTTLPAGWPAVAAIPVSVAAGAAQVVDLPLQAPAGAPPDEQRLAVTIAYDDPRLPRVELPWRLSVVDPRQLGNLLANGGFEDGLAPAWRGDASAKAVPADGFAQGLGRQVMLLPAAAGWQHASQAVPVTPGRTYLYSAWVQVADKQAGSNLEPAGAKPLYMPDVFSATNSPEWQYLSKVYTVPAGVTRLGCTPVARGAGSARFDNVRVTVHEGSGHAAEAPRLETPPVIDGDLGEWAGDCPIPLLGPGQTTILDPAWKPGAANLRGVVKMGWDERNLYLAAWIDDDVLAAPGTGEDAPASDSLVLALHPGNRAAGEDGRAFAYYLSPASPGGGSGTSTLYRPAGRSGGLSSGQLAKDSSVYEIAIRRSDGRTCYEVRFPWSELGTTGRLGGKLGCSLQLNDNDGRGRAASIAWGDGLEPAWNPQRFGVLTLVGSGR